MTKFGVLAILILHNEIEISVKKDLGLCYVYGFCSKGFQGEWFVRDFDGDYR